MSAPSEDAEFLRWCEAFYFDPEDTQSLVIYEQEWLAEGQPPPEPDDPDESFRTGG